jgi:hypothetical protein
MMMSSKLKYLQEPTNLRRSESRADATRLADQILRADTARARRMRKNDALHGDTRKAAQAPSTARPERLTSLTDLKFHPAYRALRNGASK